MSVAAVLIGAAQVGSAATASIAEVARHGSAVEHSAASSVKAARLREDMRKLWSDHVDVYTHILHMSDALSDGIIKQFPQKF